MDNRCNYFPSIFSLLFPTSKKIYLIYYNRDLPFQKGRTSFHISRCLYSIYRQEHITARKGVRIIFFLHYFLFRFFTIFFFLSKCLYAVDMGEILGTFMVAGKHWFSLPVQIPRKTFFGAQREKKKIERKTLVEYQTLAVEEIFES